MVSYTAMIQSRHSPERVFNYLADFSNAAHWDPGIERASREGSGSVNIGDRFNLVSRFMGRQVLLTYETVTIESPRRFVVRAEAASFFSEDTITVESDEEGCVVGYHATLKFRGLSGLLSPLWQLAFNRIGARAKKGLELHLNSNELPSTHVESMESQV
jgi:hypothetical protein